MPFVDQREKAGMPIFGYVQAAFNDLKRFLGSILRFMSRVTAKKSIMTGTYLDLH